jgi:hypothetical protein
MVHEFELLLVVQTQPANCNKKALSLLRDLLPINALFTRYTVNLYYFFKHLRKYATDLKTFGFNFLLDVLNYYITGM